MLKIFTFSPNSSISISISLSAKISLCLFALNPSNQFCAAQIRACAAISWNMVILPDFTPIKRTDFLFQELVVASSSSSKVELLLNPPQPQYTYTLYTGFLSSWWLCRTCTCSQSCCELNMQMCCCVWKTRFCCSHPLLLALNSFYPLIPYCTQDDL